MFWIGLAGIVIAGVGGLISIPLVRVRIMSTFNLERDLDFEIARVVLIICGVAISVTILVLSQHATSMIRGELQDTKDALQQRDRQIAELEQTAKQLRQGKTVVYYPHGQKDVFTGPLHVNRITNGPEVEVFNRMMTLQKQPDFPRLLVLAEAQIVKTGPQWLSPYLFRGVALVNLGRRDEGIEVLRFVAREAPDDEDFYKQAAEILRNHFGVEP